MAFGNSNIETQRKRVFRIWKTSFDQELNDLGMIVLGRRRKAMQRTLNFG